MDTKRVPGTMLVSALDVHCATCNQHEVNIRDCGHNDALDLLRFAIQAHHNTIPLCFSTGEDWRCDGIVLEVESRDRARHHPPHNFIVRMPDIINHYGSFPLEMRPLIALPALLSLPRPTLHLFWQGDDRSTNGHRYDRCCPCSRPGSVNCCCCNSP